MERTERGQVAPLLAVLVLVVGLAIVGLGRLGQAAVARAGARTAADAAALAGAAEGRDAAESVAADNGARLVAYQVFGPDVQVRVAIGRAYATARARREAHPVAGEPSGVP